jgi:hypothetical protein
MTKRPRIHKGEGGWWIVRYPSGTVDHAGDWDTAMALVGSYYQHVVTSTNDLVAYSHA